MIRADCESYCNVCGTHLVRFDEPCPKCYPPVSGCPKCGSNRFRVEELITRTTYGITEEGKMVFGTSTVHDDEIIITCAGCNHAIEGKERYSIFKQFINEH